MSEKRKSRFTKGIERTLNTAKYESIVIKEEISEEIEWATMEERDKKLHNWTVVLINSFKETQNEVLQELGLENKKAFFKNLSDKDNRPEPGELESLDTLDDIGSLS